MQSDRRISQELYWVGGNDRRLALFENMYPIPQGVAYNAYLYLDEKTVLMDTVDAAVSGAFLEELERLLEGRGLDYVVVHHMEPDHAAALAEVLRRWPAAQVVATARAMRLIGLSCGEQVQQRARTVADGDTLCCGRHTLHFYTAPMVHWPEVMVSYDEADQVLFSADAFGSFGALGGSLYADDAGGAARLLDEMRRYYVNIVGRYGAQVAALLKKLAGLPLAMICPLHGHVWRQDISLIVEKYVLWSAWAPEEQTAVVMYGTVYGTTARAAEAVAARLAARGVRDVRVYDVSAADHSLLLAEALRCSHLVLLCSTCDGGVFPRMEELLRHFAAHGLRGRTVALVENGSWAPSAARGMAALLEECKDITLAAPALSLPKVQPPARAQALAALADTVADTLGAPAADAPAPSAAPAPAATAVDAAALRKLSYGLFLLSARANGRDNACIVNTVIQVTSSPNRISVAVDNGSLTHDMIAASGVFAVSVLSMQAPFELFRHFGFQSGRTADKFSGWAFAARSAAGPLYLTACANAWLSARVVEVQQLETHTVFLAEVTQAQVLCDERSMTYADYHASVKPRPAAPAADALRKKGFVCRVCGYVYEGDELPEDFICPLCHHGAQDFDPLP